MKTRNLFAAVAALTFAVMAKTPAHGQFSLSMTGVVTAIDISYPEITNWFPLYSPIGVSISVDPSLSSPDQWAGVGRGVYYSNITMFAVAHASYSFATNSPTGLAVPYPWAMFTDVQDNMGEGDWIAFYVAKASPMDSMVFNGGKLWGMSFDLRDPGATVFSSEAMPTSLDPSQFTYRTVGLQFRDDSGNNRGAVYGTLYAIGTLPVPEPSSIMLVGFGLGACGWLRRRQRQQ